MSTISGARSPTVLVVDDDAGITAFLRRALAYEGYRVQTVADGDGALAAARDDPPDLIVLDVMLPGIDGVEVLRRLRAGESANGTIGGALPVLLLTARDDVAARVAGLDAGADDYLAKPFALDELAARLRALLRRREPDAGRRVRFADLTVDTASREVRRAGRDILLTPREYELLMCLLRNARVVLTREQLLERVWGIDFAADTHVLEVYIGYLRGKLEGDLQGKLREAPEGTSASRLIHTVRGVGYVLREPTDGR